MAESAIRIDKWLWHARLTKTRTLAQKMIASGKVRVNREKIYTPGKPVRIGDTLTISAPNRILVYRIQGIAQRRGPFSEARELYVDLTEPVAVEDQAGPATEPHPARRPDKRERRAISQLRGKNIP